MLNIILDNSIQRLKAYFDKTSINQRWKDKITNNQILGKATQVYLFYPELFWSIFDNQEMSVSKREDLDKLCIAGYLYYGYLIYEDKLIDENAIFSYDDHLFFHWIHEESLQILYSIFPNKSEFWQSWTKRKSEYFEGIEAEKQIINADFEEYKRIADNKAAFGKIAIDACYCLLKEQNNAEIIYNYLLEFHYCFSVGNQILDDIKDLNEDIKQGQKTYPIVYILDRLNVPLNKDGGGYVVDNHFIKKYFYTSGLFENLCKEATDYYKKSLYLIMPFKGSKLLQGIVAHQAKKISQLESIFKVYSNEVYIKTHYSTEFNEFSLEESIESALSFLVKHQRKDGSWEDIETNAGYSSVWASAFVMHNLADFLNIQNTKTKGIKFLVENRSDTLWGYHKNWLKDADSTTNVILTFLLNDVEYEEPVAEWLKWFDTRNGFSTYSRETPLKVYLAEYKDFTGWTSAHTCVSALSLYFLSLREHEPLNNNYWLLKKFIITKQNEAGLWDSYWWTSPIYPTYFIAKALIQKEDKKELDFILKIVQNLLKLKTTNNCFVNNFGQESGFYTAMVLDLLCSTPTIWALYNEEAHVIVKYLQSIQYSDGSFKNSQILQIPDPSVINSLTVQQWDFSEKHFVNTLRSDNMRLFSTAIILKSINNYKNRIL